MKSRIGGKIGIALAVLLPLIGGRQKVVFAAPPPVSIESMSLEELMEIPVFAASRHEQSASEAPASVTIVTSEQIRRYGWRTLLDVLRSVRGFHASSDRNYDSLGVRGMLRMGDYNSRILVLLNGHRINDMIYGQNGIGREFPVDVDLIDRMEVVRGPTSSLYGSNAFFAVLNVITRNGGAMKGVELSGEAASFDTYKGRATLGSRLPGGANYLLSGTGYKSRGQDLFFPEFDDPATNNGIAAGIDGERQAGAFGSVSFGDFDVHGAYNSRVKEVPTASYGTIFNDPRFKTWDDRAWLDLSWRREFADRTEATARAYYDYYQYHGNYPFSGVDDTVDPPIDFSYINKDGARTHWYGAELLLARPIGDSQRITIGGEYRNAFRMDQWNYNENPYLQALDDRRAEQVYALFLQDEIALGSGVTVNGGLRFDHYSTFGGTTNPRLAILWNPRSGTTLKFLYGRAFRAPNAYETYYDDGGLSQVGNPALRPESIRTNEAVIEQTVGETVRFTVTGFQNRINNLISQESFDPADPNSLSIYRNMGSTWVTGGEAEIEGKWSGFEGKVSYTYQDSKNRSTGEWLTNSPRHLVKGQFSTTFRDNRIVPALDLRYAGPRRTLMGNIAGGYALANFTLSARSLLPGLEVSASVYNLFDKSYADPGSQEHVQELIPQDGRSFRVKVTGSF
jgi:outer membrane receptor for ferrienterochelin and colicins